MRPSSLFGKWISVTLVAILLAALVGIYILIDLEPGNGPLPTATPTEGGGGPTETPVPPTPTGESPATATPGPDPTLPVATPKPTAVLPRVEVLVPTLRVRRGPGTVYPILYEIYEGDARIVLAKNIHFDQQPWFLVSLGQDDQEWVSGNPALVRQHNISLADLAAKRGPANNVADFSSAQGRDGWVYLMEQGNNSGRWQRMGFGSYRGTGCWLAHETDVRICPDGEIHPGGSTRAALEWRTLESKEVEIRVHAHKLHTGCGDGVSISTHRGVEGGPLQQLGQFRLAPGDKQGVTKTYRTDVEPGVLVYFIVDALSGPHCDATYLNVGIY